jgi:hypothetical protein
VALTALVLLTGVVGALAWLASTAAAVVWPLTVTAFLAWRLLPPFWGAWRDPSPGVIRHAVRTGILSLVLVGTVIAATYAGMIYSLAVLATAPLAWWLARPFAVT